MRAILLLGLFLSSCTAVPQLSSSSASNAAPSGGDRCPDQPKGVLQPKNVKPVTFANESASASGQLQSGESLGYQVQGEAGKTLSLKTKEDICMWVYSPTNEIVKDFKLAQTGQYIVQIAAKQGTQTFSLQMSLGDPANPPIAQSPSAAPSPSTSPSNSASPPVAQLTPAPITPAPSPTASQPTQTFRRSDFPKTVCGDSRPANSSAYPVTFYPIHVPNTDANLRRVQSQFCVDSYAKTSKDTGNRIIQVAAFMNQKDAQAFLGLVRSEVSGAVIGPSTTIYSPDGE
jgi:hypothetical protein